MTEKLDLDPNVVMEAMLRHAHDSFVDPRCDECGRPVKPARGLEAPFICFSCLQQNRLKSQQDYAEYLRAERPDRRVHAVKLPEGMQKK